MTDERTGLTWDYTRRTGVLHAEIMTAADAPEWAKARAELWNAAEAAEDKSTRRDTAKTGRDFIIALPHELTHAERVSAVRDFGAFLVERYGVAVDFAVHAPDRHGDDRNYHAHVLMTTRALGAEGFGAKTRVLDSPRTSAAEIEAIRASWADSANRHLEAGGHEVRIDHRSYEDRGLDRTPTVHLGPNASGLERKGEVTDLGERNRAAQNDNEIRAALESEHAALTAEIIALAAERERRTDERELRTALQTHSPDAILAALTARRSTFTDSDLARELSKVVADPFARKELSEQITARPDVVILAEQEGGVATRYTTEAVLSQEQAALAAAKGLAEDRSQVVSRATLEGIMARPEFGQMNEEQRNALLQATGPGGIAIIAGEAGTGKSYTLQAIRQAYEAEGHRVIGLSYTNAVVQDMKRDGFAETRTITGALQDERTGLARWGRNTVLVVDEAAMLATKDVAALLTAAQEAKAKVILSGDDKQLGSIARGGLFGVLAEEHGAAALSEVVRVRDDDQKRAFNRMHEGDFKAALETFDAQGRIQWGETQGAAHAALVAKWAADSSARPEAVRFVFAYTNAEALALNADLRAIRERRGELGESQVLNTKDGPAEFATGDRVQFTGSAWSRADREAGLVNGMVGTIREIDARRVSVALDTKKGEAERVVNFTVGDDARAGEFNAMRHGYAGTIYKGQGRTVDEAYALHSQYWRSASSYVAATRHRNEVTIFAARELAGSVDELARQMGRGEEKRAASQFYRVERPAAAEKRFAATAEEATGRPNAVTPSSPVAAPGAVQRVPTNAEIAAAQQKAARVGASRDAGAALYRQHKRDLSTGRSEAANDAPRVRPEMTEDRSKRSDELKAIRESLEHEKSEAERQGIDPNRQRGRGRTR